MGLEQDNTSAFRASFVEEIIDFFGKNSADLQGRERAHAVGVVANTLAAFAINQGRYFNVDTVGDALSALSEDANASIESLISDESIRMLHEQSKKICEMLKAAIERRKTEG